MKPTAAGRLEAGGAGRCTRAEERGCSWLAKYPAASLPPPCLVVLLRHVVVVDLVSGQWKKIHRPTDQAGRADSNGKEKRLGARLPLSLPGGRCHPSELRSPPCHPASLMPLAYCNLSYECIRSLLTSSISVTTLPPSFSFCAALEASAAAFCSGVW